MLGHVPSAGAGGGVLIEVLEEKWGGNGGKCWWMASQAWAAHCEGTALTATNGSNDQDVCLTCMAAALALHTNRPQLVEIELKILHILRQLRSSRCHQRQC